MGTYKITRLYQMAKTHSGTDTFTTTTKIKLKAPGSVNRCHVYHITNG